MRNCSLSGSRFAAQGIKFGWIGIGADHPAHLTRPRRVEKKSAEADRSPFSIAAPCLEAKAGGRIYLSCDGIMSS